MPANDDKKLESELKALVAEIVEVGENEITPEANFVEDLGMDSMMALEILASIEKKFRIRIPEEELTKLPNLGSTVEMVKKYMKKK